MPGALSPADSQTLRGELGREVNAIQAEVNRVQNEKAAKAQASHRTAQAMRAPALPIGCVM